MLCKKREKRKGKTQFSRKSLKTVKRPRMLVQRAYPWDHCIELIKTPHYFLSKAKVIAAGSHGFVES